MSPVFTAEWQVKIGRTDPAGTRDSGCDSVSTVNSSKTWLLPCSGRGLPQFVP